jgi:pyrimidine operon attenuation protein/uracil phosphoribosyltransferase
MSLRPESAGSQAGKKAPQGHGRVVLDAAAVGRCLRRIAHEVAERHADGAGLALVAIASGGVPVAEGIAAHLVELIGSPVPRGVLDVTLYRDDVIAQGRRPIPHRTELDFSVEGRCVVLVEDVVFTGRTVRAAMDAVLDFGRPDAIEVATLVDRGHRELPIRVDYVGKNIPTSRAERVVLAANSAGELEVTVQ